MALVLGRDRFMLYQSYCLISQGAVSILCWCNSAISHGFRLENGIVLSNVTANLGKVYQIVFISCTMCGYLLVMHLLV